MHDRIGMYSEPILSQSLAFSYSPGENLDLLLFASLAPSLSPYLFVAYILCTYARTHTISLNLCPSLHHTPALSFSLFPWGRRSVVGYSGELASEWLPVRILPQCHSR
jgi:hypothetical protein